MPFPFDSEQSIGILSKAFARIDGEPMERLPFVPEQTPQDPPFDPRLYLHPDTGGVTAPSGWGVPGQNNQWTYDDPVGPFLPEPEDKRYFPGNNDRGTIWVGDIKWADPLPPPKDRPPTKPIDKDNDPDKNLTDGICQSEVDTVQFGSCSPEEKQQLKDALFAYCKEQFTIRKKLEKLLGGCSDKLDKLLECLGSNPWRNISFINCDYTASEGEYGHTDTEVADLYTAFPSSAWEYQVNIDIKKFNNTFLKGLKEENAVRDKLLSAFIFHELVHVCGNYLKNAIWEQQYVGELEAYLLTYLAFDDISEEDIRMTGNPKGKPLRPNPFVIRERDGDYYRPDVDIYENGTNSIYYDMYQQYGGSSYLWGGMFVWDSFHGKVICWDPKITP